MSLQQITNKEKDTQKLIIKNENRRAHLVKLLSEIPKNLHSIVDDLIVLYNRLINSLQEIKITLNNFKLNYKNHDKIVQQNNLDHKVRQNKISYQKLKEKETLLSEICVYKAIHNPKPCILCNHKTK